MKEKNVSRRDFVKALGVMGVGSVVSAGSALAQPGASPPATAPTLIKVVKIPTRPFGRTGVKVSLLALGGIFDVVSNQLVLKQALDWGVTYWDTAASYGGGKSELGMGMYLEKNPKARRDVFLVSKSGGGPEAMTKALTQSLERLKTDYIDMYFTHGLGNTSQLNDDLKAWVTKMKADKKIRFFGFSCHSNMENCLQEAAKLGWIDGIMLAYNYRIMNSDAMKAAVEAATKAGIGLTAMKTQAKRSKGEESEADAKLLDHFVQRGFTAEQAKLKAVWENQQIASICSQMPNMTILMSNIAATLDKTKLTAADHRALQEYAADTCSGYCAGCTHICEAALGHQMPVGDVMRALMYHRSYGDHELARTAFWQLPETARRGLAGFDYAAAERVCPHHLPIAQLMCEAGKLFA
jgi:hypothetical protein